tara:strand:- start:2064 stop:3179 length:1116 start_codon:yes stop_codon:yes gene_type:complete
MSVSFFEQLKIARYVTSCKLKDIKKYPIVLMLEPHFKNNLQSDLSGKIDYPEAVMEEYLSPERCLYASKECGAPMVAITGGEPLLSDDMPEIVEKLVDNSKYTYVCTNGLLINKKIYDYNPSRYLTWSIELNGNKEDHDKISGQEGVFDQAIHAINLAKTRGFRVTVNCTVYNHQRTKNVIDFLNYLTFDLNIDGINLTPGFHYERAKDQDNFLNREAVKRIFRAIFKSKNFKKWKFNQTDLYLDFLAGNQVYTCTPWATPTFNIFGWQKPCFHLAEGYYKTFDDLMQKTDWKMYGNGNYEKCQDCMTHCGHEATAIGEVVKSPIKALGKKVLGIKTVGPMPDEISQQAARPAEDVYEKILEAKMYELDLM